MTSHVPNYALYGHEAQPRWLEMVHFERIHERSSMHHFDITPHLHDGLIQVLYVTSGHGEAVIDGTRWSVRAPMLVVVPTRHVHGFRFSPDIDGPVVTAAQQPLESLAGIGAPTLLPHIRHPRVMSVELVPRHAEALMPLFDAIERETRLHLPEQVSAGTALLMALFVQIARLTALMRHDDDTDGAGRTRKALQVERFRASVEARFRERWSIDRYAEEMGMSAGQLSRICRDLMGMSALDVVNARVVQQAERELVYSTLGIQQIAETLGFADDAYFGRFFKKHTGRTPTEFRQAAHHQLSPARVLSTC